MINLTTSFTPHLCLSLALHHLSLNITIMQAEDLRADKPIRVFAELVLSAQLAQLLEEWTANCWSVACLASYLALFLAFFVDAPFCLPTSHAVIDLVSVAEI